ncbi:MAG: thioredoxin domain-containing protein, partial [Polyangia bacterium]|nr:thioredoxin domain-containing protein [Polyangia bacterium]
MPRPTRAMYPVLLYCVALLWTLAPREGRAAPATPRASAAPVLYKVPVDASPVLGPDDALVTVVVFGGLECRFSQALLQTLVVAQRAQARDLRIVWKHFPLAMHSRAVPAAVAAVEAHKAGKFWQFMDRLRTARYALDDASLERAAVAAGVPGGRVLGALKAGSHRVAVLADQLLGTRLQVSATPTFFVNGLLVPGGAIPSATLQVHLNQALREARKKLGEPGATRKNLYERIISGGAQPGPQAVPVLQKLAAPVFSQIPIAMPGSRPSADALRADGDKTVRLVDAPAPGPEVAIVSAILVANFRCGNLTEIWNAFQEV